jgi:hypothetical protein
MSLVNIHWFSHKPNNLLGKRNLTNLHVFSKILLRLIRVSIDLVLDLVWH